MGVLDLFNLILNKITWVRSNVLEYLATVHSFVSAEETKFRGI